MKTVSKYRRSKNPDQAQKIRKTVKRKVYKLQNSRDIQSNGKNSATNSAAVENEENITDHTDISIPEVSDSKFLQQVNRFEQKNINLQYKRCESCQQVQLDWNLTQRRIGRKNLILCCSCRGLKPESIKELQESLPIWVDSDYNIHYELPEELSSLTEGEKLMIQRINVYVPIHHLNMGQTGCKGHCAAFM